MIRHMVVLSFAEHCTAQQHTEMLRLLGRLAAEVPQVRYLSVGVAIDDGRPAPDVGLVVDVDNPEALADYLDHPFHRSVGAFFGPIKAGAAAVDFHIGASGIAAE